MKKDLIEIDGSYGEGGGQILRTSLSLSCLFRKPLRIFNIRKGRKKSGLMPQHLTAVRAAQLLSSAEVKGDSTGSTELVFSPGEAKGGEFFFDIGTAGSTSLVLQTLIPCIVFSIDKEGRVGFENEKTTITLKGGTHVPFSPCFHYLLEVFVPFLNRIGIKIKLSIESYGFYPKGGGKIRAEIFPVKEIKNLNALESGRILRMKGCSAVGNLPLSIAERQKKAMLKKLCSSVDEMKCAVDMDLLNVSSPGQGTFLFLQTKSEHSVAGFTAIGERGKRAETVGEEVATEFINYVSSGAALDHHMSDQIVLYLSLSRKNSVFTTSRITQHLLTNLWAVGLFHKYIYSIEGEVGKPGKVTVSLSEL